MDIVAPLVDDPQTLVWHRHSLTEKTRSDNLDVITLLSLVSMWLFLQEPAMDIQTQM